MAFLLDGAVPGRVRSMQHEANAKRAASGGAKKAKQLNGYVNVATYRDSFRVSWRWRNEKAWRHGFVATRDEAEELAERMREKIADGEDPGELPQYDPRPAREVTSQERTPEEIAEARARIRALMSGDAPRCPLCTMLLPCSPCIPEMRERQRTERRER